MKHQPLHGGTVLGVQYGASMGASSGVIHWPSHGDAVEVVSGIYDSKPIDVREEHPFIGPSRAVWIAIIAGILVLLPAIHWLRHSEGRVEYPEDES